MQKTALIVGISGVIGSALAEKLLANRWRVYGLSRGITAVPAGCTSLIADLTDEHSVRTALKNLKVDRVFFSAWARQPTEQENIRVNGAMVSNVLDALGGSLAMGHVALVTGLKHYLGPFEAYATGDVPLTPFREEQGRLPVDNFYYEQEDRLFAAADRYGFTWSVHRPHTIVGYAIGNAMNMGVTLAVYATLCQHTGQPFIFPGSATQWHGLTDMTDARLLAAHLQWAATHPAGQNQDFNVVNGDIFRWQWMWARIAAYFQLDAAPYPGDAFPLAGRMQAAPAHWQAIAERFALREPDISRLVSWWHTDADLGRPMEIVTDMSKSRKAGFTDYQNTLDGFIHLFDRLKAQGIIPS